MEGRTIARPDGGHALRRVCHVVPSMEGRTIARPDCSDSCAITKVTKTFNGGPDNCPARPGAKSGVLSKKVALQWRAGQLPGQTVISDAGHGLVTAPSMEGRTIARPDPIGGTHIRLRPSPSMEGRTIARPDGGAGWNAVAVVAPSMEGRTIARPDGVTDYCLKVAF